jgi:transposase InsO family protein
VKAPKHLAYRIAKIFKQSRGTYGSPRIYKELCKQGQQCSKNTVASIMREYKLKGRVSRIYANNAGLHRFYKKVNNLRLNQPELTKTNQVWVGDVTYIAK